ncbi:MAG: sigma-70 family RNA polymerase sigma factor [Phycisphaeraceae bacterium]|nr:sigma-70 family RNA polymerase sigma factor [Phycisphaeraceae bacterium]
MDRAASRNQIRAATDAQLWAFVLTTSDNLVLENGRVAARLRRLSGHYGDLLRHAAATVESTELADANASLNTLANTLVEESDRELFLLKVRGLPNRIVAQLLGQQQASIRQRWSRLCRTLRATGLP